MKEGPAEQEDTHYSAICAAEKDKDVLRKARVSCMHDLRIRESYF